MQLVRRDSSSTARTLLRDTTCMQRLWPGALHAACATRPERDTHLSTTCTTRLERIVPYDATRTERFWPGAASDTNPHTMPRHDPWRDSCCTTCRDTTPTTCRTRLAHHDPTRHDMTSLAQPDPARHHMTRTTRPARHNSAHATWLDLGLHGTTRLAAQPVA
jgi:hypothetical protein